jgi:hypothetical protein
MSITSYEQWDMEFMFALTDEQEARREQAIAELRAAYPEYASLHDAKVAERRARNTPIVSESYEKDAKERTFEVGTRVRSTLRATNGLSGVIAYISEFSDGPRYGVRMDYDQTVELWHRPGDMVLFEEAAPKIKPREEIVLVGEKREVGDVVEVKEIDGTPYQYRVTACRYISEREAEEMEEAFDIFDAAGWNATAQLVEVQQ